MTGFLVGLALTFRSTTGYERYNDGRKYWAQLSFTSQSLARIIWTHAKEREGEQGKDDLMAKMCVFPHVLEVNISHDAPTTKFGTQTVI